MVSLYTISIWYLFDDIRLMMLEVYWRWLSIFFENSYFLKHLMYLKKKKKISVYLSDFGIKKDEL